MFPINNVVDRARACAVCVPFPSCGAQMRLVGGSGRWSIETGAGVDCSIAVRVIRDDDDDDGPRLACFGLRAGCRGAPVSRVADGAAVNCESITVCAHASATHTEGVGHGSVGVRDCTRTTSARPAQ